MYVALYLTQLMIACFATGLLFANSHRYLKVPLYSRFAFGACLAPHFIGALTLTVLAAWPDADPWMVIATPCVLSALLISGIAYKQRPFMSVLTRQFGRHLNRASRVSWYLPLALIAVPTAIFLSYVVLQNAFRPAIGHDALIYLSEAKALAGTRDLAVLQHGMGSLDSGLPPLHPHTPLFTAYLAQALLFTPSGIGYPFDHAARFAFQATLPLLIVALSGFTALTRRAGASLLVFLAFSMFAGFEYVSSAQSRDAFRLAPMVVLIAMLVSLIAHKRWSVRQCLAPAVAVFFSIHGHTLNLYFLALIGLWFVSACLLVRAPAGSIGSLAGICALLAAMPLYHYVEQYVNTGNVLGHGMANFHLVGTPLMEAFLAQQAWGQASLSLVASLSKVIQPHGLLAASCSAGAAVVVVYTLIRLRSRPRIDAILGWSLMTLLILFVAVPLSDVFRGFAVDIKEAYISNYRYALVAFMLCPPLIALAFMHLTDVIQRWQPCAMRRAGLALLSISLATGAFISTRKWTYYESPAPIQSVVDQDLEVCRLARALPADQVWLTDRYSIAYFCEIRPVHLYTPFGRRFFAASGANEATALLRTHNVGMVSLATSVPDWWPSTSMYTSLQGSTQGSPERRRRIGYWEVFSPIP